MAYLIQKDSAEGIRYWSYYQDGWKYQGYWSLPPTHKYFNDKELSRYNIISGLFMKLLMMIHGTKAKLVKFK